MAGAQQSTAGWTVQRPKGAQRLSGRAGGPPAGKRSG
jgi:hypothetical protein